MSKLRETHKRLYSIYNGMKQRCTNPHNARYARYGGRGIKVCDEWQSDFDTFCEWALKNGYSDGLTLERININENYCPENCKWIPLSAQLQNTSQNYVNKTLTVNGVTKSYAEWAADCGMTPRCLYWRIKRGTPIEEAITRPNNQRGKQITINGETHNLKEWRKITGISKSAYLDRKRHGMTDAQALTLPKHQGIHHSDRLNEKPQ